MSKKPELRLVASNAEPLVDTDERPQCMFYRFAETSVLDVDGIAGANRFRKLFSGRGLLPHLRYLLLHRFTETQTRSLSGEDLEFLLMMHGGYSADEAEKFVMKALGKEIRYAETEKRMGYFMLRKKKGADEYCLVLYTRPNLYC